MPLSQYNHIFAIGTIFSALDAYNIGANDVANSFATSVSSRSLTMRQAVLAASIMEFAGAVLVGARVAGTIKSGIISLTAFGPATDPNTAGLQMLGFMSALVASATWLMICTRYSWTVSTTYSIVCALAGVGVAAGGANSVQWGWNDGKGLATIFAGWIVAPGIAAGFGATTFMLIKLVVLMRKNPIKWALFTAPFFFFLVSAVLTLSIVYKGAPSLGLQNLGSAGTAAAVVGSASVVALLSVIFWMPFVYSRVVNKNYNVRFYHIFLGPLIFKYVPTPDDAGTIGAQSAVPDYRTVTEDGEIRVKHSEGKPNVVKGSSSEGEDINSTGIVSTPSSDEKADPEIAVARPASLPKQPEAKLSELEKDPHPIEGPWILPTNLYIIARYKAVPFVKKIFLHGSSVDIHAMQAGDGDHYRRMQKVYAQAVQHENETEHLYSFVQVMTACTASFAHGANDVSNAIGPYAAIYEIWSSSAPARSNTNIPIWILVFGAAFIVLGLATYGYNIMAVLGNRLTLHSPSRGTSMELGAAITVILASIYGLPVSTTMCITGATIGVGLCNGKLNAVNWRALAWIYLGWILTVPIAGVAAGCLFAFIARSPAMGTSRV